MDFNILKQKLTNYLNQRINDNKGFIQQGKFTTQPIQQGANDFNQNFVQPLKENAVLRPLVSGVEKFGQTIGNSFATPLVNKTNIGINKDFTSNQNIALKQYQQATNPADKQRWLNLLQQGQQVQEKNITNIQDTYSKTGGQIAGEGLQTAFTALDPVGMLAYSSITSGTKNVTSNLKANLQELANTKDINQYWKNIGTNFASGAMNPREEMLSPGQSLTENKTAQAVIDIAAIVYTLGRIGSKTIDTVITNKLEQQTLKNILHTDTNTTINEVSNIYKQKVFNLRQVLAGKGTPAEIEEFKKLNEVNAIFKNLKNVDGVPYEPTIPQSPVGLPQGEETTVYRTSKTVEPNNQVFTNPQGAEMYVTPNEPVIAFKIPTKDLKPNITSERANAGIVDYVGKDIIKPSQSPSIPEVGGVTLNEKSSLSTPILKPETTNIAPPQVSPVINTSPKTSSQLPTIKITSSNGSIPPINPQEYVSQLKLEQKQASAPTPSTLNIKIKSILGDIKRKLVDSTAPIEDTLFSTIKKNKLTISPSDNISNQIDRSLRSHELAGQFAKDNGLVDVIKQVPNIDALDQYLIAKHATEVTTTTGRDLVKDQELVNQLQGEYEPYAKQVVDYGQKLLDYSVQSGLVDARVAEQLKKQYPNYVPLNRIFSEIEKSITPQGTGKGVASLSKQTVVQRLKGSERAIASPIESLLSKTVDAFSQGERNIAGKLLASYEKLPGNPFEIRELKPGESYPHTFSYLENGVKRTFATTPEVAAAAKFLDKRQLGFVGNLFAAPVRLARIGITGINLPFIASNLVKDQVSAFVNSDKGLQTSLLNPVVFVKALWTAVGHGAEYDNWIRSAGGGTSFDISRSQPTVTVKQVRSNRNILSKILYTATHPAELLRAVENIIGRGEEMTRLQQFIGMRDALVKEGKSLQDANILAAKASREATVNFSRSGDWGKALNSVFLYMNAGIQGSRTLLRNLKAKPIKTTAKIVISVLVPLTIITAWNESDKKRKEAYDDIQDWEKDNNLVLVPSNPTKDPKTGKWNVIKIPMSQEFASMTVPFRKGIESTYGYEGATAGDITKAVISSTTSLNVASPQQLFGQFTPQAVKPGLEMALNKNMFTGTDIVPQYLDGKLSSSLAPEQQVREDTSGTARIIGGVLNTSPIKVEQFTKSAMGGVGSQLINFSDTQLANLGLIPQEQVGGQSISEGFSSRFSLATGGQKLNNLYDSIDKANQTGSQLDLNQAVENKDKVYFPTLVKHKDGTTSYTLKSEPNLNYSEPYSGTGKKTFETSPEAPKTTIERINLASKAIATNPANTKSVITAIFTQERMRKITGDTLILERENYLNDTTDTTDAVDHIIPLSLGGNNSDSNLRYISAEANSAKAKLETSLYTKLLNKEITGTEARKQISDYIDQYETPSATSDTTTKTKTDGTQYQIKNKTNGNIDNIDLLPISKPEYTGQKELDKKIKSKYTSAITKQVNDIVKLYEDGQLTAEQAESMISKLKSKSGTGTKKAKAVAKIAKVKTSKISYKISASKKKPMGVKIAKRPNLKALTSTKISAPKLKYDVGKVGNIKIAKIQGLTVGRKIA